MSTSSNEVRVGIMFTDGTTRTYKLPEVPDENLANVKTRIQSINASITGGTAQAFTQTFVSTTGAPVLNIASGKIITTEEEIIYGS